MDQSTLHRIFNLPPGGFLRSHSGFFQRLPRGEIAFLPSIFRLPWHARKPRLVETADVVRILRAETIELVSATVLGLMIGHYYFFDLFDFYLNNFNILFGVIAHFLTILATIIGILLINNVPFSLIRSSMLSKRPIAEGALSKDALKRWRASDRLWRFSLQSDQHAAELKWRGILLYIFLLLISLPLFGFVLGTAASSDKLYQQREQAVAFLIIYGVFACWAFLESIFVLKRRHKAYRHRLAAHRGNEVIDV